ncbi:MAG: glycoside hydrolase family 1 protein [Candidatus Omnitrophota bacterium]|jgi:beta-glucosidase
MQIRPQTAGHEVKKNICAGLSLFLIIFMVPGYIGADTYERSNITTTVPTLQEFTFPKGFLWGAGTSSHQVEGNNTNNDWWQWEQKVPLKMRSGLACDEWNRFEEDFKIAQSLGFTAYRFSVEWSRIEPSPGQFDGSALEHYRKMILSLKSKGLEPIVTLNHFTIPLWFVSKGGWLSDESPELFARYARKTTETLGSDVHYWITLNEPASYAYNGYMVGSWPPGEKSTENAFKVVQNLAEAHVLAYVKINEAYAQKGWNKPMIGIAHQVIIFSPRSSNSLPDRISAGLRDQAINHLFIQALIRGKAKILGFFSIKLPRAKTLDFIGLDYFKREYVSNRGFLLPEILGEGLAVEDPLAMRNYLGWEIYPKGLYTLIKKFSKYKLPILITGNGVCTNHDAKRSVFILEHLKAVALAMNEGAPVIGYFYWSFLDNYEWTDGFAPRFGLIGVDYTTQERTIRGSAREYEQIIKSGKLDF